MTESQPTETKPGEAGIEQDRDDQRYGELRQVLETVVKANDESPLSFATTSQIAEELGISPEKADGLCADLEQADFISAVGASSPNGYPDIWSSAYSGRLALRLMNAS